MIITLIILPLIFGTLIYLQVVPKFKNKKWHEVIVYLILLLPGILYSYGLALGIDLPNPSDFINLILKPISKSIWGSFK
jgi:hypothetical protein